MSLIHDTVSERAKHQENTHLTQVIAGWKPYILHHSIVGTAHSHDYNMIWLYIYTFCIIYIDIRLVVITDPGRLQAWGSSTVLLSSFFHRIQSTTPVPHGRWAPSPPRWVPAPNEPVAPRIWESKGTGPPNATPPKKEGIMVVHGG